MLMSAISVTVLVGSCLYSVRAVWREYHAGITSSQY